MKIKTMSKPQQQRYFYYIMDERKDRNNYYTASDITKFKHFDKRTKLIQQKLNNPFRFIYIMEQYFNGEYLTDIDTFNVYLFLNYKKTETTLKRILDNINCQEQLEICIPFCLGIQQRYQTKNGYEYFSTSFTNDLEVVSIKF